MSQPGKFQAGLTEERSSEGSFGRDLFVTYLSKGLLVSASLGTSIMLARGLGPEGRGQYAVVMTTAALAASVGTLAVDKALVYHIARGVIPSVLATRTAAALTLILGALACLVAFSGAIAYSNVAGMNLPHALLVAAAVLAFVNVASANLEGILRGSQLITSANLAQLLRAVFYLAILASILAIGDLNPSRALMTLAAAGTLSIGWCAVVAIRNGRDLRPAISRSASRALMAYGLLYLAQALANMLHLRVGLYIVGAMLPANQTGYYALAVSVVEVLDQLAIATSFVLIPWIASQESSFPVARAAAVARVTLLATGAAALVLGLLAPTLIHSLYGAEFLGAVTAIRWLLPGLAMHGLFLTTSSQLVATNRLVFLLVCNLVVFGLNAGLNVALVPSLGITGASIASTVTHTVAALSVVGAVVRGGGSGVDRVGFAEFLIVRPSDIKSAVAMTKRGLHTALSKEHGRHHP